MPCRRQRKVTCFAPCSRHVRIFSSAYGPCPSTTIVFPFHLRESMSLPMPLRSSPKKRCSSVIGKSRGLPRRRLVHSTVHLLSMLNRPDDTTPLVSHWQHCKKCWAALQEMLITSASR
eukprot:822519-Prymnesium_polylepis.1